MASSSDTTDLEASASSANSISSDTDSERLPPELPPTLRNQPWYRQFSWLGLCFLLGYLGALGFYLYVRAVHTLDVGRGYEWYAILVFATECLANTSMLCHIIYLLPPKPKPIDTLKLPITQPWHIRILIPCYTEDLDIVRPTLLAAAESELPPQCRRTIYLCDDGKDPEKEAWVRGLNLDCDVVYIRGHVKVPGEVNGKSGNLNNVCSNIIYPDNTVPPPEDLVCVFDADMVAKKDFFLKTLPLLATPKDAMVLTPQYFHNFCPDGDVFDHNNFTFWNHIVPGFCNWGGIMCTGTNYVCRATALKDAGFYPPWTLGEDVRLGVEMQKHGYVGHFVKEELTLGECPDTIRGTFMQRSRWCKGNLQNYFTKKNTYFDSDLPWWIRIVWGNPAWYYMTSTITFPIFLVLPIIGAWFGLYPLVFNTWFAIAFTIYMAMNLACNLYHIRSWTDFKASYFSQIGLHVYWWTQCKATFNCGVSALMGRKYSFKTTIKTKVSKDASLEKTEQKTKKKNKASTWDRVKDYYMPIIILSLSFSAVVAAIIRAVDEEPMGGLLPMLINVFWGLYNCVPQFLLLYMSMVGINNRRSLPIVCALGRFLSEACFIAAIGVIWGLIPTLYNYEEPLGKNFLFMNTQMSGILPSWNKIDYRGNSGQFDSTDDGIPLVGGYYTEGDSYIKYGMPLATTTAMMAWGFLTFPGGYAKGNGSHVTDALNHMKWAADYMITSHISQDEFVAQVGDPKYDSGYWGRAERMTMQRPAFIINADNPGSDVLAQTAAALAAVSTVYQTRNRAYSQSTLLHAQQLYSMATKNEGLYSQSLGPPSYRYNSTSYLDDITWAATWLYRRTGDTFYFNDAETYWKRAHTEEQFKNITTADPRWFWDNMMWGADLMLANMTGFDPASPYTKEVQYYLDTWIGAKQGVKYTPKKLAYYGNKPVLRDAVNAAFFMSMYAEMRWDGQKGGPSDRYVCWSAFTLNYIMGDSSHTYVTGHGPNPPLQALDQSASCPGGLNITCGAFNSLDKNEANAHTLYGALVQGPDANDYFNDTRRMPQYTSVSLEYNSGLPGLLAAFAERDSNQYMYCGQGRGFWWSHRYPGPVK